MKTANMHSGIKAIGTIIQANNISHPTTQVRIMAAMQRARLLSGRGHTGIAHVANNKGHDFIRVSHYRGEASAFQFYDVSHTNITNTVLSTLRSA